MQCEPSNYRNPQEPYLANSDALLYNGLQDHDDNPLIILFLGTHVIRTIDPAKNSAFPSGTKLAFILIHISSSK